MKVFLGGTCNGSVWRDILMPMLSEAGIDYFNPVVEDWTKEAQIKEEEEKAKADIRLYVLTPKMSGVFSIAELVDDSNKYPNKTICLNIEQDDGYTYEISQYKSITAVLKMVEKNGVAVFKDMYSLIEFIKRHMASSQFRNEEFSGW